MGFLEIERLGKRFGSTEALRDISLEVDEGGFLVLVGPSGCGKSTLLNMIAGFEAASEGDIRIAGRSVAGLHPSKRDIAMVFQSYALYPNMSVADNIGFGMETRGVPKPERRKKIDEVAAILQIEPLLKRRPAQLSGGQRQRVAMGRALVRDPRVFLFDEPLSNLDARLRVDMRTEIKKLHQRLGTTIVYVTHDQIEAMTLATRIAVLRAGEVQQIGTPDDIYNRPANTFVADFMGSPAMNRVGGRIERAEEGLVFVAEGMRLALPPPGEALAAYEGRAVELGIRAEDLTDRGGVHAEAIANPMTKSVESRADGLAAGTGRLVEIERTVELVEPTGSDTFVFTRDGEVSMTARVRNDSGIVAGERARLVLDMRKTHFFDPSDGRRIE